MNPKILATALVLGLTGCDDLPTPEVHPSVELTFADHLKNCPKGEDQEPIVGEVPLSSIEPFRPCLLRCLDTSGDGQVDTVWYGHSASTAMSTRWRYQCFQEDGGVVEGYACRNLAN